MTSLDMKIILQIKTKADKLIQMVFGGFKDDIKFGARISHKFDYFAFSRRVCQLAM